MWQFIEMLKLDARAVEACRRFVEGVVLEFTEKKCRFNGCMMVGGDPSQVRRR
jgi:hypothetical protein